jgi:hypothetical protein
LKGECLFLIGVASMVDMDLVLFRTNSLHSLGYFFTVLGLLLLKNSA